MPPVDLNTKFQWPRFFYIGIYSLNNMKSIKNMGKVARWIATIFRRYYKFYGHELLVLPHVSVVYLPQDEIILQKKKNTSQKISVETD